MSVFNEDIIPNRLNGTLEPIKAFENVYQSVTRGISAKRQVIAQLGILSKERDVQLFGFCWYMKHLRMCVGHIQLVQ